MIGIHNDDFCFIPLIEMVQKHFRYIYYIYKVCCLLFRMNTNIYCVVVVVVVDTN